MKRILLLLLMGISVAFVQCKQDKKENSISEVVDNDHIKLYKVTAVPYEKKEGYLLKNQPEKKGVRHVKITNQAQFATLFDPNKAIKEVGSIDFSKSFVLALVGIPSTLETDFSIISLKEKEDFIELTYCLEEEEKELAKAVYPYAILVIDKKYNKDIRFLIE
ncbi:hypothetical protein HX004_05960 [Myroides sp. 1354]|uniref:hypothetical protein n=1 Tax=unclassified Myroides TaxID=2642485 RepID=UPI002578889A|nr:MULTISPECIES: hypothetical protein [unclassified Myroides]MDM1044607.1 hypothetical protein [Myroides sp. R163-1]MDM1055320.1 hypothetical protein [Myroides sp. 1354]MDM1068617.1 hypothetical protein [Myroides sp. 1372]